MIRIPDLSAFNLDVYCDEYGRSFEIGTRNRTRVPIPHPSPRVVQGEVGGRWRA